MGLESNFPTWWQYVNTKNDILYVTIEDNEIVRVCIEINGNNAVEITLPEDKALELANVLQDELG